MDKVQILMSTYNGEKYLREQLDSLISQDYAELSILIRDDGSSDSTIDILQEYSENYDNIEFYTEENVGVIKSFFRLMRRANPECKYYAFSDQDDVWKEKKISTAVEKLKLMGDKLPAIYCCAEHLVDENLKDLDVQMKRSNKRPSFGNALVENIVTGATAVCNRELLKRASEHEPEFTIMHDWWLYLIASDQGKVYYDENSYLDYRQHSGNVLGSRNTYWDEFIVRVKRFRGNKGRIRRQISCFTKEFDLVGEHKLLADIMLGYSKHLSLRVKGITSGKIYRQRKGDHIIFKLLFLTNHL